MLPVCYKRRVVVRSEALRGTETVTHWRQDNLKHNELTPYLHAKLMEQMMSWVYFNPPPDMAAALAENQRAAAEKAVKGLAANAARAAKAAAVSAAREMEGAVLKEEDGPLTPPAHAPTGRAAKSKASNSIAKKLALESARTVLLNHMMTRTCSWRASCCTYGVPILSGPLDVTEAPEHVALGARLRKQEPTEQKKGAKKLLVSVVDVPQHQVLHGKECSSS